ncbi:corneodesmosin-like [Galleria mellonella]|uniref:Corneodesmosin-like n=1 Tax=Galleria mellonella TaxID=7137 RepID=A0ABM3N1U6_GALME|nr:corneodesmosin-like [Galleria mellonella]
MANRIILLCFFYICLSVSTDCRKFGGSRSSGRSGGGRSWGSYSHKPSTSRLHETAISRPTYNYHYPASSSRLSGDVINRPETSLSISSPTIFGSGLQNKPSSSYNQQSVFRSSGLSGHSYPASSGLSGDDNKKPLLQQGSSHYNHNYPISRTGLSGGSNYKPLASSVLPKGDHNYPLSNLGLSGDSVNTRSPPLKLSQNKPSSPQGSSYSSHNYPISSTGLSGVSSYKPPLSSVPLKTNYSYPSSLSGLSGSNNKKPTGQEYPPSLTGLSGANKPVILTHDSGIRPSYPIATGLSGNSPNTQPQSHPIPLPKPNGSIGTAHIATYSNSRPLSNVSLSGFGSKYPSSSSGMSGSGPYKPPIPTTTSKFGTGHIYPMSSTGLSGISNNSSPLIAKLDSSHVYSTSSSSGSGHSYPQSPTRLSGAGHPQYTSTPGFGHGYPSAATGLSGSGNNLSPGVHSSRSHNWYNTNTGNLNGHIHTNGNTHYGKTYNIPHYSVPSYYSSPQYVYINEYRNSGSRYSDLLIGLAIYNIGRSHSHYHDHYYYDDYYRRRYESLNSYTSLTNTRPKDSAICTLKVKEDNNIVKILRIPCEIVSTFTKDAVNETKSQSYMNQTVCVTNVTTVNSTNENMTLANSTLFNVTVVNGTVCTSTVNTTDPLSIKGPPVSSTKMECVVEIQTKDRYLQNNVDCNVLLEYAKMPEPKKKESIIMPSRQKLKSWLAKPPWWMSLFISV